MDWTELLNNHGSALLLYARQWAGSMADAEDALQDGFVKFWRFARDKYDDPVPYLFKSVKHSAIDISRRRRRRLDREEKASKDSGNENNVTLFESQLEHDEERVRIEAALRKINPEQREVLVMKIWGDMTFRQIAESLDLPQNTVASRYRYGLAALKPELEEGPES